MFQVPWGHNESLVFIHPCGCAGTALRPDTAASHHQRGGSTSDVLESAAVERGVAKLFRGKVQPYGGGGLKFTQSAVLSAIIIVGLKSLMEYIRLQTLGKAGNSAGQNAYVTSWALLVWQDNSVPKYTCRN